MKAVARGTRCMLVLSIAAAAACTSDRAPSGIEQSPEGLQSLVGTVASCDVNTLQSYAKDYFGSGNNPASSDIKDLASACRNNNQAAANAAVFAVLDDVGAAAAARVAAATVGGSLVNGVIAFLPASYGNDTPANYAAALGARGMFRIRSGLATTGQRGGAPDWRIKATWATGTLVYGYPISDDQGGTTVSAPNGKFEIKALPAGQITPSNKALIAYCDPTGSFTNNWIQHKKADANDLTFAFLAEAQTEREAVCGEPNVAVAPSRAAMLLAAVDRAWSFVGPTELFAQDRVKTGGVGGFGSDLSPHFVANLGQTVSEYLTQPTGGAVTSGVVSGAGYVTVKVKSQNGSVGIPNAWVELTVANNSGTPAGAIVSNGTANPPGCPAATACAYTGQDGVAHFPQLHVNKPGGYKLTSRATFDGYGASTVISDLFQIQNP